ncbi:MAG TPA: polysaccharide deacetylase family protein [Verrucomicrobiae bacterium]|jgi:peptidoglycan/xylan/chitin deacetylase (PgdA/CDA1 family)
MLRRALTRFQWAGLAAALLATAALAAGRPALFWTVLAIFSTVIGFGAALPSWKMFGPFVCRGQANRRCVALTFDDGPDARSTPALLELLKQAGVEAAFFCIGRRVAAEPALAARIAEAGHLLGNHTYNHSMATNFFTAGRVRSEMARTQSAIQQATGAAPLLFRPPWGLSNPRVFRAARHEGLTVVGWSARGLDTQITDPERVVARIERRLAPGAIILLHDGNIPAGRLVATVKLLLDRLRALGYDVVRLDRILS